MSESNFPACDKKRQKYEGGMSRDPNDPGNWTGGKVGVGNLLGTKYGIAANTYPNVDIPNLTQEKAAAIFKRDYWDKVGGDFQPAGVDLCLYDTAVNSGTARARQFQQKVLGSTAPAFSALAVISAKAGKYTDQVKALCAARLSFLHHLGSFGRYGKGWTARVADVEATGVKMVLTAANMHPEVITKQLEAEATEAKGKSSKSLKGAGTAAGTEVAKDGGTSTQIDVTQFDWTHWLAYGALTLLLVGLAIYFLMKWHQHKERTAAYAAVAKEI